MNKHSGDKLLEALLQNEATGRLRETSLRAGLAAMRRRRVTRQVLVGCAVAGMVGAVAMFSIFSKRVRLSPAVAPMESSALWARPEQQASPKTEPPIERITDEQLLDLFPNQTVALVGSPGCQQFRVYR